MIRGPFLGPYWIALLANLMKKQLTHFASNLRRLRGRPGAVLFDCSQASFRLPRIISTATCRPPRMLCALGLLAMAMAWPWPWPKSDHSQSKIVSFSKQNRIIFEAMSYRFHNTLRWCWDHFEMIFGLFLDDLGTILE